MIFTFFLLFLAFTMYFILFSEGVAGIQSLLIALQTGKRRVTDVSNLQTNIPYELQKTVDKLSELGFVRFGEVSVNIFDTPRITRLFISPDGVMHAEVAEGVPGMVFFTTVYHDHAVVETGFPFGEKIETPDFRSHTITSDIEKACLHHIQQITEFGRTHGLPKKLENMREYLIVDGIYRARYVRLRFRRLIWINILKISAVAYAILSTLILIGLLFEWDELNMAALGGHMIILLIAIFPGVIVAWGSSFLARWTGQRETKST
jgi:hypothetical protein